jgi:hypothetical protein
MINAGPAIVIDQDRAICHSTRCIVVQMYAKPARMKTTPPTISYFQEIIRTINKTKTGILCMNNPRTVPQKSYCASKISSENMARKRRNKIDRILGAQYINLLIFGFVAALFCCLAIKFSFVRHCFCFGGAHNSVFVMRRRIDCVHLQLFFV